MTKGQKRILTPREVAQQRESWSAEQWKETIATTNPDIVTTAGSVRGMPQEERSRTINDWEWKILTEGYANTSQFQQVLGLVYLSDEGWEVFRRTYWNTEIRLRDTPLPSEISPWWKRR